MCEWMNFFKVLGLFVGLGIFLGLLEALIDKAFSSRRNKLW
jgi:hypothetical protein